MVSIVDLCGAWARSSTVIAVCAMTLCTGAAGANAQAEPADLVRRVDTLWTKTVFQTNLAGFEAGALGGNPRAFIVAGPLLITRPPERAMLLVLDPLSGDTVRSVESFHTSSVTDMTFAANANVFASADYGTIKVWRWPEMELIRQIKCPSYDYTYVLLSADGRRVFSSLDAVMYDVETGDTVWQLQTPEGRRGLRVRPRMTRDERFIITAQNVYGYGERALLLDAATGELLGKYRGDYGTAWITGVDVSDDGKYVAVSRGPYPAAGVDKGYCVIYDSQTGTRVGAIVLDGTNKNDGVSLQFTPYGTGLFVWRAESPTIGGSDVFYYPHGWTTPVARWQNIWFGSPFSHDGKFYYSVGAGTIVMGRLDLAAAGTLDEGDEPALRVWPNPTDGTISISGVRAADGPLEVTLSNSTGRQLRQLQVILQGGLCRLENLAALPPGVYTVQLQRGGTVVATTLFTKR